MDKPNPGDFLSLLMPDIDKDLKNAGVYTHTFAELHPIPKEFHLDNFKELPKIKKGDKILFTAVPEKVEPYDTMRA